MNSLSVPKPFTSESTKTKPIYSNAPLQPDTEACMAFIQKLFSVWEARSSLLVYCEAVANEAALPISSDLQKDSFSNKIQMKTTNRSILKLVIDQEKQIEHVVRNHSWEQVLKRCGFIRLNKTHEIAMQEWASANSEIHTSHTHD